MLCCLFAAMLLGPLGLWALPRVKAQGRPDCCTDNRRKMVAVGLMAVAVAALCLAGFLVTWTGPAYFQHICSVFSSR
jgi:hypothetical protein